MAINTCVDILFFIDIIFAFNTAYYDEDFKIIDNRKRIASSYLKGWFVVDFIAIVPFEYITM